MSLNAEVMNLTRISQNFPLLPNPEISRENYLDTIEKFFNSGTQIVVIDGEEGIGKTTLLAMFALRYPNNTISLFIKGGNQWAYDPEVIKSNLCNQLEWVIRGEELQTGALVDDAFLRTRIVELGKRARREKYYFVVDGLFDSSESGEALQKQILNSLPIEWQGFYFLLGMRDWLMLPQNLRESQSCRPYTISDISLGDTSDYLCQLGIKNDQKVFEDIHKICRGVPGRLVLVRRILETTSVESFIDEIPEKLTDLLTIEWRAVDPHDKNQEMLLAILAHDRKQHHIDELARLLNIEPKEIGELLTPLKFLRIDSASGEVEFDPEAYRSVLHPKSWTVN